MQNLKKIFIFSFILFLRQQSTIAQICRETEIDDTPQKKSLLKDYIEDCYKKRFFFEDKGIVKLVTYKDNQGNTCWYLSALVDDRYRKEPPDSYAMFRNNVIIIYNGTSPTQLKLNSENAFARDTCIQNIVGSRVYEHSTKKQFVYSRNAKGLLVKFPVIHSSGGNSHNDLIIIFNKDSTITKITPV